MIEFLGHQADPNYLADLVIAAPWLLSVTERKGKPAPVLIIKEHSRIWRDGEDGRLHARHSWKERGRVCGQTMRRVLPVIREMVGRVCDPSGIPLEMHRLLGPGRISFRGNLPLDNESGTKLALMFRLLERVSDMDRAELIARRVERFTREEAFYWLSRCSHYGQAANRWALAGMRIILGGHPGDPAAMEMLEKLRG